MAAGGFALILCLAYGGAAHAAFQPDLSVKIASEADASYLAPGIYEQSAVVQVKAQGAAQGVAAVYRVQIRNAGDAGDTFRVTGGGSASGYAVQYLDAGGGDRSAEVAGGGMLTSLLPPGGSTTLTLMVTPSALPLALNFELRVHAVSLADPAKGDEVKTATCSTGNVAAVTLSSPPDRSGSPGSVATYPYTVVNTGNTPNAFSLSAAGGWPGVLYADDGAGGGIAGDGVRQQGEVNLTGGTGTLEPGAAYRLFLAVTIPADARNSAHSEHLVTVTGTGASVSDRTSTGAVAPALTLVDSVRNLTRGGVFDLAAEAAPGDTLEYRLAVTSSGAEPAGSVVVRSEVPDNTQYLPGSLFISGSPTGATGGCPRATCGEALEAGGTISAYLGEGGAAGTGGTLPVGRTLYLYFRVQVL